MNYHTDTVNFFWGGSAYWGEVLISKILLSGGTLFRERHLSESGRSLDHLRYASEQFEA